MTVTAPPAVPVVTGVPVGNRIAAGLLFAEFAVLGVVLAVVAGPRVHGSALTLPVVTSSDGGVLVVARVDVAIGALVPLLLGAAGLLLSPGARPTPLGWVQRSLSASIVLFLQAQLNGIHELAALVAIYALTSAMVLFAVLRERAGLLSPAAARLPGVFGAMVGIVPWGLIAWYEIAPAVAGGSTAVGSGGGGPAVWVRVVTVVMLALFVGGGVRWWRAGSDSRVLSVLTPSVLAGVAVTADCLGLAVS